MLGNGTCDPECMVNSCNYDYPDCGCAPECILAQYTENMQEYDHCRVECMDIRCDFNNINDSYDRSCDDKFIQTTNYYAAIIQASYDARFIMNECIESDARCTHEILKEAYETGNCIDDNCLTKECLYQFTNCYIHQCGENCIKCNLEGECIECVRDDNIVQFWGRCVNQCPIGFKSEYLSLVNGKVCLKHDNTSRESPIELFVTSINSSEKGSGTRDSPYTSLYYALTKVSHDYTRILLLEGKHDLSLESTDEILVSNTQDPLKRVYNIRYKDLSIQTAFCTDYPTVEGCANERATIVVSDLIQLSCNSDIFHIENVNIVGDELVCRHASCNDCNSSVCRYCPYVTAIGNGRYISDLLELIPSQEYAKYATNCEQIFKGYSLIYAKGVEYVKIQNVTFSGFKTWQDSLIYAIDSDLNLINVNFEHIVPGNKEHDGVVKMICSSSESRYYNLSYTGGSVSFLNEDYQINLGITQGGFLYTENVDIVEITDVNFSLNILQVRSPQNDSKSLINIKSSKYKIQFKGLNFIDNYTTAGLILINNNYIDLTSYDTSIPIFRYANLDISDCNFKMNASKSGLIRFRNHDYLQNIQFSSVSFDSCISTDSAMIYFEYSGTITKLETQGGYIKTDSGLIIKSDERFFKIDNLTMKDCYSSNSIIYFSNFYNIQLSNFEIKNSGDHDYTLKDLAIEYGFSRFEDIEVDHLNYNDKTSYSIRCDYVINFDRIKLLSLRDGIYDSNQCGTVHEGSSSLLVYIPVGEVILDSIIFENIYLDDTSGGPLMLQYTNKAEISINNCTFRNITNSSGVAGIFIDQSVDVLMTNNKFYDTSSRFYGAVYVSHGFNILVDACTLENVVSTAGFGAGMILETFGGYVYPQNITVTNSYFYNCFAQKGDGCLHITRIEGESFMNLLLSNLTFKSCKAEFGSAIFLSPDVFLQTANITNIEVEDNFNHASAPLHTSHAIGVLAIINCTFSQNSGAAGGISAEMIILDDYMIIENVSIMDNNCTLGGIYLMGISGSSIVTTNNINILGNSCPGLVISSGVVNDFNSTYAFNQIGIYIFSSGSVYTQNTRIFNNSNPESESAGVMVKSGSFFSCEECSIFYNTAHSGAGIMATQDSSISLLRSDIFSNHAINTGSAIYLQASSGVISVMNECNIYDNISDRGFSIYLVLSTFHVSYSLIKRNISNQLTPGFLLNNSILQLISSTMNDHDSAIGSFINAQSYSTIFIEDSNFYDGRAKSNAGAISLLASQGMILNSTFVNLSSELDSAGISIQSGSSLTVSGCTFSNLTSNLPGSAFYAIDSILGISDSIFYNYRQEGVYGKNLKYLNISNSQFIEGSGSYGSAISCSLCSSIHLKNNTFDSNYAKYYGGALYITTDSSVEDGDKYVIESCQFVDNSALQGGALYIDGGNLVIKESSFLKNIASFKGGAANIECSNNSTCNFSFFNSTFEGNTAQIEGGAISWSSTMPSISQDTLFTNNTSKYGNSIASYPIRMQYISDNTMSNFTSNFTDTYAPLILTLSDIAPGQIVPEAISIALVDHYDQIVNSDHLSNSEVSVVNKNTSALGGTNKVIALEGVYLFDNIVIGAKPGTSVYLEIYTSAVDMIKQKQESGRKFEYDMTNSDILQDQVYYNKGYIKVNLRECVIGESDLGVGCKICEKETYSLDPSNDCTKCPEEATCLGNYTMFPKEGYWRVDVYTDTFYACPNKNACLGSDGYISYIGECEKGYRGNMCQPCDNGYSSTKPNVCGKCPDRNTNIMRIVGVGIAILIYCGIMTWTSFRSSYVPKSIQSIYIKILTNYLQLVGIVFGLDIPWPNYLTSFLKLHENSGHVSQEAFSFDCLLEDSSDESYINSLYRKMIIMAFIPLVCFILGLVVWSIWAIYKKDRKFIEIELVATVNILFFFIHPKISEIYLSIFSCRIIEGEGYFLIENLDTECWKGDHLFYALTVALPCVVIWIIGAPFALLMYMTRNSRELSNITMKLRFGFLYNGYKLSTYYWEFVILYRKILIIMIMVFLSSFSVDIRALAILIVLGISYLHQNIIEPYTHDILNELEKRGILVATLSVYCGLYFLSDDINDRAKLGLFVVIMVVNAYFLVYWAIYFGYTWWMVLIRSVGFLRRRYLKLDGYDTEILTSDRLAKYTFMDHQEKKLTLVNDQEDCKDINEQQERVPKDMMCLYLEMVNSSDRHGSINDFSKEEYFTSHWQKGSDSDNEEQYYIIETAERGNDSKRLITKNNKL
jgi:hypothetical protein